MSDTIDLREETSDTLVTAMSNAKEGWRDILGDKPELPGDILNRGESNERKNLCV